MVRAALSRAARLAVASATLAAIAAAGMPACDSKERDEPLHAWVAVPPQSAPDDNPGPIRVFDAFAPGKAREYGPPGRYVVVRWSPDGKQLAAIELLGEDSARLALFDRNSGRKRFVDSKDMPFDFGWSPDSTRLVVDTRTAVSVFDRHGRELGQTAIPPSPDGSWSGTSFSLASWSPDSRYLTTQRNRDLLVIDRDGRGAAYNPRGFVPDLKSPSVQFYRWTAPNRFIVQAYDPTYPTQRRGWLVTVEPGGLSWEEKQFDLDDLVDTGFQQLYEGARAATGGSNFQSSRSADGTALLLELHTGQQSREPLRFAVFYDGKLTNVDLGLNPEALRFTFVRSLDLVLTGGPSW